MNDTDWAYLAGFLDGEGHITLYRHYKKHSKCGVSKRGYEIEPRMTLANMNKQMLSVIREKLGAGTMAELFDKRADECRHVFELRIGPNAQRIIYPNIIPHLILKKEVAKVIYDFLCLRQQKMTRKEKEEKYLELELKCRKEFLAAKPWLTPEYTKRKKIPNIVKENPEYFTGITATQKVNDGIKNKTNQDIREHFDKVYQDYKKSKKQEMRPNGGIR